MTIVEILAFLPNSINCTDVIYRMISNGGTRKAIHAIINTHRDFSVEWSVNCCGEAMYKTMHKGGYPDWTIKRHGLWHNGRKDSWDGNRLDVGDLRTSPGSAGTVSFRKLAENVRTMPEGDDALDLTRMVRYCKQNDGERWRYPTDYEELLDLLGGPAEVGSKHTDGAVFDRWEHRKAPPPTERRPGNIELGNGWKKTKIRRNEPKRRLDKEVRLGAEFSSVDSLTEQRDVKKQALVDEQDADLMEVEDNWRVHDAGGTPYARALASTYPDHLIDLEDETLTVD